MPRELLQGLLPNRLYRVRALWLSLLLCSTAQAYARLSLEPINSVAAKRPPKGASLANPNKKARKYQELEFEDD
jgi:hypothetical protein